MIQTTLTIICDDCKEESPTFANKSGVQVRRELENYGWSSMNGRDRCSLCTLARLERNRLSRYKSPAKALK